MLLTLGSGAMAALGIARYAFITGEDPSDDGPRALLAEFLGYWAGGFFLFWSFFAQGKFLPWTLRGVAIALALTGLILSLRFASPNEASEARDKEPTGFKKDTTDLDLGG
ncbi:MAG: hypothetical protein WDM87_11730 [Terracidiphilus sp.]